MSARRPGPRCRPEVNLAKSGKVCQISAWSNLITGFNVRAIFLVFISLLAQSTLSSAATLVVGPEEKFTKIADAVKASKSGDTILIWNGLYEDDFLTIRHPLTIQPYNHSVILRASGEIPNGKGLIIANADLTVRGLMFAYAKVRDKNGAGIRYQKGKLTVIDCVFQENENGILAGSNPEGEIYIKGSIFSGNGQGDGYSHGIYIGKIARLEILNSYFTGTKIGHHIKSRARANIVKGSRIEDGVARSSYSIDFPNGGKNEITGNEIIQGSQPENSILINIGTKETWPHSETKVFLNRLVNLAPSGIAIRNGSKDRVLIMKNEVFGKLTLAKGSTVHSQNKFSKKIPAYFTNPDARYNPDEIDFREE